MNCTVNAHRRAYNGKHRMDKTSNSTHIPNNKNSQLDTYILLYKLKEWIRHIKAHTHTQSLEIQGRAEWKPSRIQMRIQPA